MSDPASSSNAKVSAATAVLRFGREGVELDEILTRLERVEQVAGVDDAPKVRVA